MNLSLSRASDILAKLRGMTAADILAEAYLRGRRLAYRSLRRAVDSPVSAFLTDRELDNALNGVPLAEVAARVRDSGSPRLLPGIRSLGETAEVVSLFFPEAINRARRQADDICNHRIEVFGHSVLMGNRIDWHRDPRANRRWPMAHYTQVPFKIGGGADVRQVWELNRLHHLVSLGRAYALTGIERYASEFLLQTASWVNANPPRFGVNWTVAMEAAIRAINLIAAFQMFLGSPQMTDETIGFFLKQFLVHGRFIRANLEYSHRTPSNHYLANLIGLYALGATMPWLDESASWLRFTEARLRAELDRQVLPDGVSYEGSVAYHRLVTEIFALFFSLGSSLGVELPGHAWERLERMFSFVRAYLKPDGTAPMIGDSDDGRLLRFRQRDSNDHSYLLSIAAVLTENEAFKQSPRLDEEALWWFGRQGLEAFESLAVDDRTPGSQAFDHAQVYVQRADDLYMAIDCGDHGTRGMGSHAHYDALSIELYAYGTTFLRDPGTFVYTASSRWRNLFRSTAYHNTVRVDGREISRFDENSLFAFRENVRPRLNQWQSDAQSDSLDAEHDAYADGLEGVVHRRIVTFDKQQGYWTIRDEFIGEGAHQFEFFFNFDHGLEVAISDDQRATVTGDHAALAIIPFSQLAFEIKRTDRWVSPAYATRLRSSGIIYRLHANVPFSNIVLLVPYRTGDEEEIGRVLRAVGRGNGSNGRAAGEP